MNQNFMWANLIHLGTNMWNEEGNTACRENHSIPCASSKLRFFRESWDAHMQELKDCGVNTLIIDVAEALKYESHPELAAEGAFTHDQMKAELTKLRGMGFEIIPKLNFSACHDVWLKDYSRMVSTPVYYEVCRDLIREVCDVFKPKHFHLGMDEETYENQKRRYYAVVRHGDLWWHDLYYLVDIVEKENVRAWVWSDYMWHYPELFLAKMPKTVVQNNWYYSSRFSHADEGFTEKHQMRLDSFRLLDEHGYDQVPAGSTWSALDNLEKLTVFCKENISSEHLLGMMQTTWEHIDPDWMHIHHAAAEHVAIAKKMYHQ